MLSVQGYYDGVAIRPLETIDVKPNQKVIITVVDEFIEPAKPVPSEQVRGILAGYANHVVVEKEEGAWERAVAENYGNL